MAIYKRTGSSGTQEKFSITARECTLIGENGILVKSGTDYQPRYEIPVYQRPYSWKDEQIRRFFQTLFKGYMESQPCFLGTMQFKPPYDGGDAFQVVDGQQRLSTLILFFRFLELEHSELFGRLDIPQGNWLTNKVDNGKEGKALESVLRVGEIPKQVDWNTTNRYLPRLACIKRIIAELEESILDSDENKGFDNSFMEYLLTQVFFVVIETRAGLAKTLEIFNTINTAGMDLGTDDLFKIRLFEYLAHVQPKKLSEEEAMTQIDNMYTLLSEKVEWAANRYPHRNWGKEKFTITHMLNILKPILIERNNGNRELHSYGTGRFLDELFGVLLLKENHENFRKGNWETPFDVKDMERLIEMRFVWEKMISDMPDTFIWQAILWMTRYGSFHYLIYIWLFRFYQEGQEKSEAFRKEFHGYLSRLVRYFSIRSMEAARVNHAKTVVYNSIRKMVGAGSGEISIADIHEFWDREIESLTWDRSPESYLTGAIFGNWKWAHLMCTFSILSYEENWDWGLYNLVWNYEDRNGNKGLDIEHIHPNNPDWDVDPETEKEWDKGGLRNSIGNLMYLSSYINRHKVVAKSLDRKWPDYERGNDIPSVKRFLETPGLAENRVWTPEMAKKRGNELTQKIVQLLFYSS